LIKYHENYLYKNLESITYEKGDDLKLKKKQSSNKNNPEGIKEIAISFLDKKLKKLTDHQLKLLYGLYFDNLNNGLKPRDAMNKAFQIVNCFKN
jgi:hypothetical protein